MTETIPFVQDDTFYLAQYLSHLLSCDIHVPDNYSSIWATGNELTSVRSVTQALHFITVAHTDTNIRTWQACVLNSLKYMTTIYPMSYLCPCSSMAVPLRPPMSHIMIEWSELPENKTLCTGSQDRAVTLPAYINTQGQR